MPESCVSILDGQTYSVRYEPAESQTGWTGLVTAMILQNAEHRAQEQPNGNL